ncbi:ParB/RepB/Spo0J family partition protein [Streptomyces sp. 3211]|uniref:ParB/RepB/Spo0J family partition protein n=1 Tax=Streptomyces sp. 3211 TaxID=1964449 RepID=UPI001331BEB7|nr:plasmid partitioning protein [Streptomyces sp. 3211]
MSKKELLGSGASFSSARRPSERSERGRAKALAQGDIPAYELVKHRLEEVTPTPLNPRRNFGSDEDLTRFGEELRGAQLAACVSVSRTAYLALWPEHASVIGSADFVLVNGERRYRSARHVGLGSLDFVVRDDLATSREDFLDYILSENLEREDFDVIERARGVSQLVAICAETKEFGAKSRAAERLGKSPAWVTHQLALLSLPVELQAMLSAGDLPERDGRVLARALKDDPSLGPRELLARLKSIKQQEARTKEEQQAILRAATEPATTLLPRQEGAVASPSELGVEQAAFVAEPLTAVKGATIAPPSPRTEPATPAPSRSPAPPRPLLPTANPRDPFPTVDTLREVAVRSEPEAAEQVDHHADAAFPEVPWHDGRAVADLVLEKMDNVQRTVLLERLSQAGAEG